MALSGTINGKVTLNSNYFSFFLKWTATQNIEGNYSDVTVTTYWQTTNLGAGFDTVGYDRAASITINGKTTSIKRRFDATNGTDTGWKQPNPWALQTVTERVYHNSDGTKSITISGRANGYAASYGPSSSNTSSGDCTASGSITLDTIPRASKISAPNGDIESSINIAVTRYSTSFKHKITYTCKGIAETTIVENSEASVVPWTIPYTVYATIPDEKFATITLKCYTYSKTNNSLIGTSTVTIRATANELVCAPTVSGVVLDANSITVGLTGNAKKLIRYRSTARCEITASANKAATIASRTVNGQDLGDAGSIEIQNSEASQFTFTTVDSRGYAKSAVVAPEIVNYVPLTLVPILSRQAPTSNVINITFAGNFFDGNFGAVDNELTIKFRYREQGKYTWSEYTEISDYNILEKGTYESAGTLSLGSVYEYTKSYEFEIVAQDGTLSLVLSTVTKTVSVSRGIPVFDWSNTDFHVREKLITSRNVEPDGAASIGTEQNPYVSGYFGHLYIGGKSVPYVEAEGKSGSWYYRKWSNGFCELFYSDEVTGSTPYAQMGGYASNASVSYPFSLKEIYTAVASGRTSTGYGCCFANAFSSSCTFLVVGNANSSNLWIRAIITGRWK